MDCAASPPGGGSLTNGQAGPYESSIENGRADDWCTQRIQVINNPNSNAEQLKGGTVTMSAVYTSDWPSGCHPVD